jgi:hypothetical protein
VKLVIDFRQRLSAAGLDDGPDAIAWHLKQHHKITVSPATISRHLQSRARDTRTEEAT